MGAKRTFGSASECRVRVDQSRSHSIPRNTALSLQAAVPAHARAGLAFAGARTAPTRVCPRGGGPRRPPERARKGQDEAEDGESAEGQAGPSHRRLAQLASATSACLLTGCHQFNQFGDAHSCRQLQANGRPIGRIWDGFDAGGLKRCPNIYEYMQIVSLLIVVRIFYEVHPEYPLLSPLLA